MIKEDCEIHSSVKVTEPVNLYGCVLKKDVFVGPFVEIQKDVFVDEMGIVGGDGVIQGSSKVSKVKKMKKKGHSSVPYGSGYKKVNEASCAKKTKY